MSSFLSQKNPRESAQFKSAFAPFSRTKNPQNRPQSIHHVMTQSWDTETVLETYCNSVNLGLKSPCAVKIEVRTPTSEFSRAEDFFWKGRRWVSFWEVLPFSHLFTSLGGQVILAWV